jgi:hypothetical protein
MASGPYGPFPSVRHLPIYDGHPPYRRRVPTGALLLVGLSAGLAVIWVVGRLV